VEIIDISRDMLHCDIYPGDPVPRHEIVHSIPKGDECNLSAIYAGLHTGTHVDAPLHFLDKGGSVEEQPLSSFIGECAVLAVPPGPITADYVERKFPRAEERILIKGGGRAYFMDSAAMELAMYKTKLIGTDSLSVGTSGAQTAVHRAFLRENIAILEGLVLENVEPGNYFLMAQPLKIGGAEAAFCRAVLIADYIFWSR
jgi:arylformamidase